MTIRKAYSDKILVLGVDGMDPRLTRKYVDEGKMPNVKKYLERGAARNDLTMLGGHPTVTPPMWTTLATGCYANVHGITGFARTDPTDRSKILYNMDSRLCKAEQVWNAFAEAGKKTLVFHWPGASWPPSSDSDNLFVIDGSSPGGVAMAVGQLQTEFVLTADTGYTNVVFKDKGELEAESACVVTDLDLEEEDGDMASVEKYNAMNKGEGVLSLIMSEADCCTAATENPLDAVESPIKEATGWAKAPAGAKEFTLLLSQGLIRRPGLIYKSSNGDYDRVAIYKSKKEVDPIVVLEPKVMVTDILDDCISRDQKHIANRNMKVLELSPDGNHMKMWVSAAMNATFDGVYKPTRLFKEIVDNVGYPKPTSIAAQQDISLITDCMWDCWNTMADWQSRAILHLIESENLDVVFSHFHSVDLQTHQFIKHLTKTRASNRLPHEAYQKMMDDVYTQLDDYLGRFIHLLDEGWTILIISDHALVASKYDKPVLAEAGGVTVPVMMELGYTVLKKNAEGKLTREIDWSKTKAIAVREGHIYLNLKGRDPYGIVDPEDQYELEEEIITALYSYKSKETGHRVVSVALRNREAVLLGQGGPEAGDIFFCLAEGYNFDHFDCLSTTLGECDTSIAPIFVAAGKGIKENFETDRIIRQIDFAATVAALGGVRMPAQCEGAPVYQIFDEEF